MPEITINLSTEEMKILKSIGKKSGRTEQEIAEGLMKGWCAGQINGFFLKKLDKLTTEQKTQMLGDIT